MQYPLIVGITHGDYNGVGYEIILKALADEMMMEMITPVVFGSSELAALTIKQLNLEGVHFTPIKHPREAHPGRINIVDVCSSPIQLTPGNPSKEAGNSAVEALEAAATALKEGDIDLLVTAPIDKNTVHSDKFPFTGHTEWLQERFANEEEKTLMVLFSGNLRMALTTVHEPISKVAELITRERVEETIRRFDTVLRQDFGCDGPLIAVLSLNPHRGDQGLIGTEEKTAIEPAIAAVREDNILAFGPYAADGFFASGAYKKFDGIVAMYHDQGLAPFKALAGSTGVNFTAGLEIIRTSPDHGTAYDIAGKGLADSSSMREAIFRAIDIYRSRERWKKITENPL